MATDAATLRREAILERIACGAPIEGTLDDIVLEVEALLPGARGSILLLDGDRLRGASVARLPPAYNAAIEGVVIGPNVASCGSAAWRCEPVYVNDIQNDPLWVDYRDVARVHGLAACWSVPIASRRRPASKRVLGTFAVYFDAPRGIDPHGESVLSQAEKLACIALEAHETTRALREEEGRYRTFVDNSLDAFFLHDAETGRIVEVNVQACQSLGYTAEELIGKVPQDIDPDVTTATLERIISRVAGGEPVTLESRHRRKDGETFPVEVRVKRVHTGGKAYNMALVRDITERRKLEEQLAHARRMEAVGRLAGGIAHDFNNLLTVVDFSTDVLLSKLPEDSPLRADVLSTRQAGTRAAALTAQLLAFSRRSIVAARPLDLNGVVERMVRMLGRLIGENIKLSTQLAAGLPHVMADPSQVEQVVMNLVMNARDAMPRGGALLITTHLLSSVGERLGRSRGRAPTVALSVADTGAGMSPEVRQRLFEPYFTTKGPGRGLGLATVYGIMKQSGGEVQVERSCSTGSTITVTWLATDARSTEPPPESAPTNPGAEVILLVEDESEVRRLLAQGLSMHGYEVLSAGSAEEALEIERSYPGEVHMVVTDVVMPNQGGRELVEALQLRRPSMRVLYISGYTDDEIVRLGGSAAGGAFLKKPFTLKVLTRKIRDLLTAPP